ncbi:anti-sigma factor antagonist [Synechococcus sp. PCC 6312]|uniref:anti-sigma factor antagonist n=1 Tax=Synechococcus sp. (strain ATCC 27167 / PCC 6312) TaxID=195253 RepID=UPI00029F47B0|nr:anti-sigma factor antagonist [Synechococcus sp. PCC 6312]AFY61253.1 anti-anti-sigma factor [Synechococcus sp. PCC 6312]
MAFTIAAEVLGDLGKVTLIGELDGSTAPLFKEKIEEIAKAEIKRLVLLMAELEYMSSAGLRVLIFAKQKMGTSVNIYIVGAQEMVQDTIDQTGLHQSFYLVDTFDFAS